MVTIIKTEFMKLKRYFIVWIGVSLMLLTVLLTLFTTMADDGMVWDYQFLFEQVVKHFVTMIFPMCITLISGYMISREYTDDTLKNIETLPISFRKLLAGKLIVSAILSLFLGIVCFAFTVVANFIMGYDGFALIPALTGLVQMALLGLFLYLTMLPIIVLTSRHKWEFPCRGYRRFCIWVYRNVCKWDFTIYISCLRCAWFNQLSSWRRRSYVE